MIRPQVRFGIRSMMIAIALAAGYLSAYQTMVRMIVNFDDRPFVPTYSFGGSFSTAFFAPAHALDRQINKKRWGR